MTAIGFFRDAHWLHRKRARAYAVMLAAGMGLALGYHWISLALGHHPGVPALAPGKLGPTDFLAFWSAGRLALAGHPAAAWDLAQLAQVEHAVAAMEPRATLAFFYPPVFLLLCLPFAALPYFAGFAAFVGVQSAALLVALRRLLPAQAGWLPLLAFPGLLLNAATGQNGFISAACVAAAALLLDRRPVTGGAALGLMVFKPHLALCVPVALLAARRWQAAVAAAATASALLLMSWWVLGTASYQAFLNSLPQVRDALDNHREDWGKLQSIFTTVRLAGAPLAAAYVVQGILAAGVVIWLARLCWRRPGAGAEMAALGTAALLCTPHVLDYDLAITGVPLAWIAGRAAGSGWRPWEKSVAGAAYIWPLLARIATQDAHLAIGPFVLLGLLLLVARRAAEMPA
ncbi:MAG TPA: glycosyltransferase family 87 protein [Acetobacteraceae bacterium]|nr:glycosyltransferase family 87 protein [Acetobacteraceae bacterium]